MKKYSFVLFMLLLFWSCEDETYEVDYQDGYPNALAGNWLAYDFQGGVIDLESDYDGPYDLVTALDANSNDSLVISNIYDSGVRVKAGFSGRRINVTKGRQLEVINDGQFGIKYVSIEGELLRAQNNDEQDVMILLVGLYDELHDPVDSVLIYGIRKTGFENIEDQNFD